MGLCGSSTCGCGVTSSASTATAINGHVPTITVTGSGVSGDPYDLTLNSNWADEVADLHGENVAWIAPSFQNSWVNFGSGTMPAGYRKIGDIVYIRGFVKSGTINTTIFTLPVGYRPLAGKQYFPALGSGAAAGYYCVIDTVGTVNMFGSSNASFSLSYHFSTSAT